MNPKERVSLLKAAYKVADEAKENVYLITKARDKLDTSEVIPYIVLESQADAWDKANGELIVFRVK